MDDILRGMFRRALFGVGSPQIELTLNMWDSEYNAANNGTPLPTATQDSQEQGSQEQDSQDDGSEEGEK